MMVRAADSIIEVIDQAKMESTASRARAATATRPDVGTAAICQGAELGDGCMGNGGKDVRKRKDVGTRCSQYETIGQQVSRCVKILGDWSTREGAVRVVIDARRCASGYL